MLLARDKSQLLIIDVQEKLLPAMSDQRVAERCVRLVRAARTLEIPITISEQYPQGIGPTVEPIREALGYAGAVMDKVEFSCMKNGPLRERLHELRRQGRPQVVIGGIEAHVCVAQTAIDLEEPRLRGLRGRRRRRLAQQGEPQAGARAAAQVRRRRGRQRDGGVRVAGQSRHAGVQGAARAREVTPLSPGGVIDRRLTGNPRSLGASPR